MQFCPKCGANVEGLVHHCDCCGALLVDTPHFLTCNSYLVSAAGDITDHLNALVDRVESCLSDDEKTRLPTIVVTVYCYPQKMIKEMGLRDRTYYSRVNQRIHITLLIELNSYLSLSKHEKQEMVANAVCNHLARTEKRYSKQEPGLDAAIAKAISAMEYKYADLGSGIPYSPKE